MQVLNKKLKIPHSLGTQEKGYVLWKIPVHIFSCQNPYQFYNIVFKKEADTVISNSYPVSRFITR
jgi:hypothetical protein